MACIVYVSGNDGSGKSTFARRFADHARARGLKVTQRHYYDAVVRRMLRSVIERIASVDKRKRQRRPDQHGAVRRGSGAAGTAKWVLAVVAVAAYQACMAVEYRVRRWTCAADVLLIDRSFVDDLVSIHETLRIRVPYRVVHASTRIFPIRRLFFLQAGHGVEYGRIVQNDLSPQMHERKAGRYAHFIDAVEKHTTAVKRVRTDRSRGVMGD